MQVITRRKMSLKARYVTQVTFGSCFKVAEVRSELSVREKVKDPSSSVDSSEPGSLVSTFTQSSPSGISHHSQRTFAQMNPLL